MKDIVGVILAGGLGRRLDPLTRIANKHLLPVYDRPMIFFPLEKMARAGLKEIMVVCGERHRHEFERILGDGSQFGFSSLAYEAQIGEEGIAKALELAQGFADGRRICVVLGDNLFRDDIRDELETYRHQQEGARILMKKVSDPARFGVPVFDGDRLVRIEEKPTSPKSSYAVVGIYFYDTKVFGIIKTLRPSGRGEYEITDVSNRYRESGDLTYGYLDGWWSDCGTFESLYRATGLVRNQRLGIPEDCDD